MSTASEILKYLVSVALMFVAKEVSKSHALTTASYLAAEHADPVKKKHVSIWLGEFEFR